MSFLIRGCFTLLIVTDLFDQVYPTFLEVNVWDSLV